MHDARWVRLNKDAQCGARQGGENSDDRPAYRAHVVAQSWHTEYMHKCDIIV